MRQGSGMGDILKQAQKMQQELMRIQEELAKKTVETSSGGGMVTVIINGRMELTSIKIEKDVVNPDDIEMLQEMPTDQVWFIPVLLSECKVPNRTIGGGQTLRDLQWEPLYKNWERGTQRILEAMGADFYPRLTAVAKDNAECNRLVNEQAHVSLLLAGPGVIATISLAPLVIALFYSTKFYAAVDVLRWLCLGMALRILSWPMGFIVLAKGAQQFFFWSEAAWTVVYLALAWVCVDSFGLNGAGIAFFGSYIFHVLMVALIVRRLSGFRWSVETKKASFFFIALLGLVFWATHTLPPVLGVITGTLVAALSGVYSVRVLIKLVSPDRIPRRILTLLAWFHLADPGPASA